MPTPVRATAWAIAPLTEREYKLFRALVHREAGIELGPAKRELLIGRLSRRIRELGLASFGEYYDYATGRGGSEELVQLLDLVATNETHFFREPGHFEFVERTCCPRWIAEAEAGQRSRTIRVWSAACSSGEEPYSIAMLLLGRLAPAAGWTVEVLATDISTRVLRRGREAMWPLDKRREIPTSYLRRFMQRGIGSQAGWMRAGPELRAAVRFGRLNLMDERYAVGAPFDLIFCRNVLIYFDARTKAQVVGRLAEHLAPDGHLFLGHAETVYGMQTRLQTVGHTVYRVGARAS